MLFSRPDETARMLRRTRALTLVLIVGSITASACGGASPASSEAGRMVPPGIGGSGATTIATAPADPLQAQILADGDVTDAEMEQALLAIVSCVREGGFEAELTHFEPGGEWGFEYSGGTTSEEADRADERFDLCSSRFISEVELAYLNQHGPTEQELAQRELALLHCLADEGFDVAGTTRVGEFLARAQTDEAVDALLRCQDRTK